MSLGGSLGLWRLGLFALLLPLVLLFASQPPSAVLAQDDPEQLLPPSAVISEQGMNLPLDKAAVVRVLFGHKLDTDGYVVLPYQAKMPLGAPEGSSMHITVLKSTSVSDDKVEPRCTIPGDKPENGGVVYFRGSWFYLAKNELYRISDCYTGTGQLERTRLAQGTGYKSGLNLLTVFEGELYAIDGSGGNWTSGTKDAYLYRLQIKNATAHYQKITIDNPPNSSYKITQITAYRGSLYLIFTDTSDTLKNIRKLSWSGNKGTVDALYDNITGGMRSKGFFVLSGQLVALVELGSYLRFVRFDPHGYMGSIAGQIVFNLSNTSNFELQTGDGGVIDPNPGVAIARIGSQSRVAGYNSTSEDWDFDLTGSDISWLSYEHFSAPSNQEGQWAPLLQVNKDISAMEVQLPSGRADASYYRLEYRPMSQAWFEKIGDPILYPDNHAQLDLTSLRVNLLQGVRYAFRACGYRSNTSLYVCSQSAHFIAEGLPDLIPVAPYDESALVRLYVRQTNAVDDVGPAPSGSDSLFQEVGGGARTLAGVSGICRGCLFFDGTRFYVLSASDGLYRGGLRADGAYSSLKNSVDIGRPQAGAIWKGALIVYEKNFAGFKKVSLEDGAAENIGSGGIVQGALFEMHYMVAYRGGLYGYGRNTTSGVPGYAFYKIDPDNGVLEEVKSRGKVPGDTVMGLMVIRGQLIAVVKTTSTTAEFRLVDTVSGLFSEMETGWNLPFILQGTLVSIGSYSFHNKLTHTGSWNSVTQVIAAEIFFNAPANAGNWIPLVRQVDDGTKVAASLTLGVDSGAYYDLEMAGFGTDWKSFKNGLIIPPETLVTVPVVLLPGEKGFRICGYRSNGNLYICSQTAYLTVAALGGLVVPLVPDSSRSTVIHLSVGIQNSNGTYARTMSPVRVRRGEGAVLQAANGEAIKLGGSDVDDARYIFYANDRYYAIDRVKHQLLSGGPNINDPYVALAPTGGRFGFSSGQEGKKADAVAVLEGTAYIFMGVHGKFAKLDLATGKATLLYSQISPSVLKRVTGMIAYKSELYAVGYPSGTNVAQRLFRINVETGAVLDNKTIIFPPQATTLEVQDPTDWSVSGMFIIQGQLLALGRKSFTDYQFLRVNVADGRFAAIGENWRIGFNLGDRPVVLSGNASADAFTYGNGTATNEIWQVIVVEHFDDTSLSTGNWRPGVTSMGSGLMEFTLVPPVESGVYFRMEWTLEGQSVGWEDLNLLVLPPENRVSDVMNLVTDKHYGFRACGFRSNTMQLVCSQAFYYTATDEDKPPSLAHIGVDVPDNTLLYALFSDSSNSSVHLLQSSTTLSGGFETVSSAEDVLDDSNKKLEYVSIFFHENQKYYAISGDRGALPTDTADDYALYWSNGDIEGKYVRGGGGAKLDGNIALPQDTTVFEGNVYVLGADSGNRRIYEMHGLTRGSNVAKMIVDFPFPPIYMTGWRGYLYVLTKDVTDFQLFQFDPHARRGGRVAIDKTLGTNIDERLTDVEGMFVLNGNLMILGTWEGEGRKFLRLSVNPAAVTPLGAEETIQVPIQPHNLLLDDTSTITVQPHLPAKVRNLLVLETFPSIPETAADWQPVVELQSGRELLVSLPAQEMEAAYYRMQWQEASGNNLWKDTQWQIPGPRSWSSDAVMHFSAFPVRIPKERYGLRVCSYRSNTSQLACSSPSYFVEAERDLSELREWRSHMLLAVGWRYQRPFVLDTASGEGILLRAASNNAAGPLSERPLVVQCMFQYDGHIWIGDDSAGSDTSSFIIYDPIGWTVRRLTPIGADGIGGEENVSGSGESNPSGCALHQGVIYLTGRKNTLITINPQNGGRVSSVTPVSVTGLSGSYLDGLASDGKRLLGVDDQRVYSINVTNGKASPISSGTAADWSHAGPPSGIAAIGDVIFLITRSNLDFPGALYRVGATEAISRVGEADNFDLHLAEELLFGTLGENWAHGLTVYHAPSFLIDPELTPGFFTMEQVTGLTVESLTGPDPIGGYDVSLTWDGMPNSSGYSATRTSEPGLPDEYLDCVSGAKVGHNRNSHTCVLPDAAVPLSFDHFTAPLAAYGMYLLSYKVRAFYQLPGMKREYSPYSARVERVIQPDILSSVNIAAGSSSQTDIFGIDDFLEGEVDLSTGRYIFGLPLLGITWVEGSTFRHTIGILMGVGVIGMVMAGFGGPNVRTGRLAAAFVGWILWVLVANIYLGMPTYWIAAPLVVLALCLTWRVQSMLKQVT